MAYISKQSRQPIRICRIYRSKNYASKWFRWKTILNLKMQGAKIDVWGSRYETDYAYAIVRTRSCL